MHEQFYLYDQLPVDALFGVTFTDKLVIDGSARTVTLMGKTIPLLSPYPKPIPTDLQAQLLKLATESEIDTQTLFALLMEFATVFTVSGELGDTNFYLHKIKLAPDAKVVHMRPRPIAEKLREGTQKAIEKTFKLWYY